MGLLGLLLTVVILILGGGYYFFGVAPASQTFINEAPPVTAGVPLYENLKDQANTLKETVESKAQGDMVLLDDPHVDTAVKSTKTPSPENVVVTDETPKTSIVDRLMSSGFSVPKQERSIDTIVLHSSYNPNGGDPYSVSALVKIYEEYGVGAHYLIDRDGKIYRLVADKNIAYHAGVSEMPDGRKNVNDFSLGIEIMNKKDTQFTKEQYSAVKSLVGTLKKKYAIKHIVGHGDIAPDRKTDPWNFDWKKLD